MPAALNLTIEGHEQIFINLKLVPKVIGAGYELGSEKAAEYLYKKSQVIVPRDTEALAKSGYYMTVGVGLDCQAIVGYGGPDESGAVRNGVPVGFVDYAVYVHEMVNNYHEPPTQAKYLEQPVKQYRHQMMEIVRREMDREWRLKLRGGVPFR